MRYYKIGKDRHGIMQWSSEKPAHDIVSNNTKLYKTCLTFLASAVERKDEERARYWSRIAFGYAPIEKPTRNEVTNGTNSN